MPDKSHLQAANGADKQKKTAHDPLAQGEGGAKRGKSIPQKGGNIPANVKVRKTSRDHLTPKRGDVAPNRTAERGGGSRHGHDRTSPLLGKSKSKDFKATRVI